MLWSTQEVAPPTAVELGFDDDEDEEEDGYPSLLIGPALRQARMRAGIRQSDIARHFDIDSSIPSRWEGFDSVHNGRTTRYKPVPGRYLAELARLLNCPINELAPEVAEAHAAAIADGWLAPDWQALTPTTDTTTTFQSQTTFHSMSGYTIGGGTQTSKPSPVPGRPPSDLMETGQWRRPCPGCKKVFLESLHDRAPFECDACKTAIRARVVISIGHLEIS